MRAITDEVSFDPETNTYRVHHDWQGEESVTTTVVRAVAAVTNTPPTDLDPLHEVVNTDALNQIYEPTSGDSGRRGGGRTTFTMNGCEVTVNRDGEIEIAPPDEERSNLERAEE